MTLASAVAGLGVAMLPKRYCWPSIQSGALVHVLPEWRSCEFIIHAVFMSRKGMLPSVRAFIDYLVDEIPKIAVDPEASMGAG